jgi:2-polyprenyl-3-methyl-5-hydroxy-6-metoxy-1,4-benzoquinol methylase
MTRRWISEDVAGDGERVSHLRKDFDFFGHLSIYRHAVPMAAGARVLDIGCGAGYGSAYLADHGARHVTGIDASATAIEFSQHSFQRPNLVFRRLPAKDLSALAPGSFDFVFTSNALEHIPDVSRVIRAARRLLTPAGRMLAAVPPITNDHLLYLNLVNRYHLNLWSPRQWQSAIETCFERCTPVLHGVRTIGGEPRPEDREPGAAIDELSFVFAEAAIDDFYRLPTLTAIFIADRPRSDDLAPRDDDPTRYVDESFSRSTGEIPRALHRRLRRFAPSVGQRMQHGWQRAQVVLKREGVGALIGKAAAAARRMLRSRR